MKLITVLIIFFISIGYHVIIWRLKKPANAAVWFFKYGLFIFPILYFFLIYLADIMVIYDNFMVITAYEMLFASYILMYPAIEQSSMSLDLIRYLKKSGRSLPLDYLHKRCNATNIIGTRILQLKNNGFITNTADKIKITPKGARLAFSIQSVRKILGIKVFEG